MAQVIEILCKDGSTRPVFKNPTSEELDFSYGTRVLPATHIEQPNSSVFFFIKKHEPGTPFWSDGGYEVREIESTNSVFTKFRAFHLDALIVHPKEIKERRKHQKNHK